MYYIDVKKLSQVWVASDSVICVKQTCYPNEFHGFDGAIKIGNGKDSCIVSASHGTLVIDDRQDPRAVVKEQILSLVLKQESK